MSFAEFNDIEITQDVVIGALLEVGLERVAVHVSVRDRYADDTRCLPYPTFADSSISFDDLDGDELHLTEQAFLLGHQVHDRNARLDDADPLDPRGRRGIDCPSCDDALDEHYARRAEAAQ